MNKLGNIFVLLTLMTASALLGGPNWVKKTGIKHGSGKSAVVLANGYIITGCATADGLGITLTQYYGNGTYFNNTVTTTPTGWSKTSGLSMAVQSTDNIVVAGTVYEGGKYKVFIARYTFNNENLELDTTFAAPTGYRTDAIPSSGTTGASAFALSCDTDDKLYLAGTSVVAGGSVMTEIVYDVNADTDPTVKTWNTWATPSLRSAGLAQFSYNVTTPISDPLYEDYTGGFINTGAREDFGFRGWRAGGTACTGPDVFTGASASHINNLTSQIREPDTLPAVYYIVAGGFSDGKFALARYTLDCALDTDLTNGFGPVVTPPGTARQGYVTTPFDEPAQINAIAVDYRPNLPGGTINNIYAVGGCGGKLALACYDVDGNLVPNFGAGGKMVLPLGHQAQAESLALISGDSLIFSGNTDGELFIASYGLTGSNLGTTGFGYVATVDQVFGNNATGQVNGTPFTTISAAITAATNVATTDNPVLVWVQPGIYYDGQDGENFGIKIPQYVVVRGASQQSVIIKPATTTTYPYSLVSMNAGSGLEDVTLNATSSIDGITLNGIYITNSSTTKVRGVHVAVTATGTSPTVTGIASHSAVSPTNDIVNVENCSVNASSSGTTYAISQDTNPGTLRVMNSAFYATGSTTTAYGAHTTANGQLYLTACTVAGGADATAPTDIYQQSGNIYLDGSTILVNTPNPSVGSPSAPTAFTKLSPAPSAYIYAYDTTGAQSFSSGSWGIVTFDTANTSNRQGWSYLDGVFTCPADGWYHIEYYATITAGAAITAYMRLAYPGTPSSQVIGSLSYVDCTTAYTQRNAKSMLVYLLGGQTIQLEAQPSAGTITLSNMTPDTTTSASTSLSIMRVG